MKKIIPVAVLISLFGAAQAQVSVYGLVDMSYGKNQIAFPAQKEDIFSGGDNGSSQGNSVTRFGIKGSNDVGSGVKANFQLESGGITSKGEVNPGGAFFNRAVWAGFSGSFGEFRVGKQDSVAFQTMNASDLNGFSNANAAGQNAVVAPWLRDRQERSVQYINQVSNSLKLQLGFQPEGNVVNAKSNASAGVAYAAGPVYAAVTAEGARTTTDNNFYAVAGSYDFGVAKMSLGYTDGGAGRKGPSFGVSAPVGGVTMGFQVAKNNETSATATEIFATKEIFKSTYAYAEAGNLDKTANGYNKGDSYAIGFIYVF